MKFNSIMEASDKGSNNSKIVLHTCTDSPPGRTVQIALKFLGIPYEIKTVDFDNGEHFSEEFLKVSTPILKYEIFFVFKLLQVVLPGRSEHIIA